MLNLLEEIQFRDSAGLRPELIFSDRLSEKAADSVNALLPSLPNPQQAVYFLNRLIAGEADESRRIFENPRALKYALTIFSYSRFLSDSVIRYPEWLLEIAEAQDLHRGFLAEQYEDLLTAFLPAHSAPRAVDLALFRRRQLLRIVLRDALRIADLSETTEDLSHLADAILNATWGAVRDEMMGQWRHRQPEGNANEPQFSILAMGKLGGRELNYSSDIDLMFIHADDATGSLEFFRTVANRITEMLSSYTSEGTCYRVDLRLRPDGRFGEICHSLSGAKQYYSLRARDWELQMLIKARVAAGDSGPGRALLEFVEPLTYKTTTDFEAIETVSETRARIHEKQQDRRNKRSGGPDVKLARGGIRDIEFLVQCLQRLHGGRDQWVRHGGTLLGLSRLRDKEFLSQLEYARLASAYQFLRHIEHRLQFDEDRQTHTLPEGKEQLDLLARRMPPAASALPSADTLERELDHHLTSVQDLYDRVIHSRLTAASQDGQKPQQQANVTIEARRAEHTEVLSGNLRRYLEQKFPVFTQLILNSGLYRNPISATSESFESFVEKVVAKPEWLEMLEKNGDLARCTLDVFEHSQYFADQLISHTELLRDIAAACDTGQNGTGFDPPREADGLRRFFRSQMIRIQSDSVHHGVPVFETLKQTSELAESVVACAYEIAVAETCANAPPGSGTYMPGNQMMVVALGRLGMLEFDLASDADLVFIIPDEDASETLFWTGVAERLISVISAYTGDGVVFSIDTRLRPNGGAGGLVQTESSYKDYFAHHAEAWEGISYMKARAVAGNSERATQFLGELQEIDWRRYGQNGRSRAELAQMRGRLEREQGPRNPLKAAPGGYYDIDFALMYLRLRSAGLFFKVLNTPERIDIIEKMGHLDRDDANLLRKAATFYRAVDHGLRILSGHAEGRLPTNRAQIEMLTRLVNRWTPENIEEDTLHAVSDRIRRETRAFFERLFGKAA